MQLAGKKLAAMPSSSQIRIIEVKDMATVSTITPSGHSKAITCIEWNKRRALLASLSTNRLIVHSPTCRADDTTWTRVWTFEIPQHLRLPTISWALPGDALVAAGDQLYVWQINEAIEFTEIWKDDSHRCDQVQFAGHRSVFASKNDSQITIWTYTFDGYLPQELRHVSGVRQFSWKPWRDNIISSGAWSTQPTVIAKQSAAMWYEAPKILLTLDNQSVVRIWVETVGETREFCVCATINNLSDIVYVSWLDIHTRALSDDRFRDVGNVIYDWITAVDSNAVLHLWKANDLDIHTESAPLVSKTDFELKLIDDDDSGDNAATITQLHVMGYFAQNLAGYPSSLYIILERSDHILLSFRVIVSRGLGKPVITQRSWQRGHSRMIETISAHPSLPLIATVSRSDQHSVSAEVMVFWMPLGVLTSTVGLRPSCLLCCPPSHGEIRCVVWAPTLHSNATPILLVVYVSGIMEAYSIPPGKTSSMLHSPKGAFTPPRSPLYCPWTSFEQKSGRGRIEYQVAISADPKYGLGIVLSTAGGVVIVSQFNRTPNTGEMLPAEKSGLISLSDEFIGVNDKDLKGKNLEEVTSIFRSEDHSVPLKMRFRSTVDADEDDSDDESAGQVRKPRRSQRISLVTHNDMVDDVDLPSGVIASVNKLKFDLAIPSVLPKQKSLPRIAGSLNLFGGWEKIGQLTSNCILEAVIISPTYSSRTGDYANDNVLVFALVYNESSKNSRLRAWHGTLSGQSLDFQSLGIKGLETIDENTISCIATERDYRRRTFSVSADRRRPSEQPNFVSCLLYTGSMDGSISHWRCHISNQVLEMSLLCATPQSDESSIPPPAPRPAMRGHLALQSCFEPHVVDRIHARNGILHIAVDDPNRIAVVRRQSPADVEIWEAESGLGLLRHEETIDGQSHGPVLGICWCAGHIEFSSDAVAVQYQDHSIWIYSYDTLEHRWRPIRSPLISMYSIFDCTRDASAYIIACGNVQEGERDVDNAELSRNDLPVVIGSWDNSTKSFNSDDDDSVCCFPSKVLPDWHPYVLLTELFGMCSHLGDPDAKFVSDQPTYRFDVALKKTVQTFKLLAQVVLDKKSMEQSKKNGMLVYCATTEDAESDTPVLFHRGSIDENFSVKLEPKSRALDLFSSSTRYSGTSTARLEIPEMNFLKSLFKELSPEHPAAQLFETFSTEHSILLQVILAFVHKIQSFGFDVQSSADLGAQRYFAAYIFEQALRNTFEKDSNPIVNTLTDALAPSGILWALHSKSQNFLITQTIVPHSDWEELRHMWPGLWIQDSSKLCDMLERIAKVRYAKTKDAMSVCLFYIALGKPTILKALASMSKSTANQNLAEFLQHDFTQQRWINAAVKNAYSLLRKKQYEAAIGFFLLPNKPCLQQAIRVCVSRMKEPSLALVISRVVEFRTLQQNAAKDTQSLLTHDCIPLFREKHQVWLESAAHWWVHAYDQAMAVLLPSSQTVDIDQDIRNLPKDLASSGSYTRCRTFSASMYFIDLTSLPLYFQYVYSAAKDRDAVWIRDATASGAGLVLPLDIEHMFSFTAYVCKQSGLVSTAMLQMLQARQLVELHATMSSNTVVPVQEPPRSTENHSTAFQSSVFDDFDVPNAHGPPTIVDPLGSPPTGRPELVHGGVSTYSWSCFDGHDDAAELLLETEMRKPRTPWEKVDVADVESRRWSSSAFVSCILGSQIARELIAQIDSTLVFAMNPWPADTDVNQILERSRHQHCRFISQFCLPLCKQFIVEREFALESALIILQPHAQKHLVACAILLEEIGRHDTMIEWIQYMVLNTMHSCSALPLTPMNRVSVSEWADLTCQLCYVQQLCAEKVFELPATITTLLAAAVRVGLLVLAWSSEQDDIVAQLISNHWDDMETSCFNLWRVNIDLLHAILPGLHQSYRGFEYAFLDPRVDEYEDRYELDATVKSPRAKKSANQSVFSTVLMIQVIRAIYCQLQKLVVSTDDHFETDEKQQNDESNDKGEELSTALFIPRRLWRSWTQKPLDGIKMVFTSMEMHLHTVLRNLMKAIPCFCSLYGLNDAVCTQLKRAFSLPLSRRVTTGSMRALSLPAAARSNRELVWLYMQQLETGVPRIQRHMRVDERVYVKCFTLDALIVWCMKNNVCETPDQVPALAQSYVDQHLFRLLLGDGQLYMFVSPWEVDARDSVRKYMYGGRNEADLELGWNTLTEIGKNSADISECRMGRIRKNDARPRRLSYLEDTLQQDDTKDLWSIVRADGWIVTAITQIDADGLYLMACDQRNRATLRLDKSDYLSNLFAHVQRNTLFYHLGLPYRYIALIQVRLIKARNLIPCNILSHSVSFRPKRNYFNLIVL